MQWSLRILDPATFCFMAALFFPPHSGSALQKTTTDPATAQPPVESGDLTKPAEEFVSLFNCKDLEGWKNPYAWGTAEVVDGEIHLTADRKFFLVTERTYSDFVLEAEICLPATGAANSGIMFRCHVEPDKVFGYQAECDPKERAWTGGLYDEGRRGWLYPKAGQEQEVHLVQAPMGQWVRYPLSEGIV